ncbi:MAG: HD domain-containing protein [Candidatus Cloacimonetes bacterium]|nr:HD domain-containing protein [Candidatus Cloacimonadota bacterium]
MEKIVVKNLGDLLNQEIVSYFLVAQKELREGQKDFYLRMQFNDNTGSVAANIWNNAKSFSEKFEEGDVVKVKAVVISYKGQVQLTVNKLKKAEAEEYDLSDFVMSTQKDTTELSDKLFSLIDGLKNEYLKQLMKIIFENKEFYTKFANCPAAKTWHHNYIGGLLEHTVAVARICEFSAKLYNVDKDLLICGALLHDIGKVQEYNYKTSIEFSNIGRLIGHLSLGDQIVYETAKQINAFPDDLLMKVRHLILAHHGEYEKASVRLPQTLEATLLHHADNLDAQTTGVLQLVEAVSADAEWSDFDKLNNRYYYRK